MGKHDHFKNNAQTQNFRRQIHRARATDDVEQNMAQHDNGTETTNRPTRRQSRTATRTAKAKVANDVKQAKSLTIKS